MNFSVVQVVDLRACLAGIAPFELKGMRLLREQPHLVAGTLTVPRDQLVEAVTEIAAYTARCQYAAGQLAKLSPVPLRTVQLLEYGL